MIEFLLKSWQPILEVLILWFLFYKVMTFFEGTRAAYVFRGILILIASFFFFQLLGLRTLEWILTKLFAISVLIIVIIFQPELRYGLARLGRPHLFSSALPEEEVKRIIQEISEASVLLSKKKNGAIIAIEMDNKLKTYKETGVTINSEVNADLIVSIFSPGTPLHDGGIIVSGNLIIAAACLFPLTDNPYLSRAFGTRHRAAIGLTENSDAVAVVISEETGAISVAKEGVLSRNLNKENLEKTLFEAFRPSGRRDEDKSAHNA